MTRKRILICGSLSFIMSNFIRYLIYRSKDYEIFSIDQMLNDKDVKRIYFNHHHIFNVGDINDINYLEQIFKLVKPDVVINGIQQYSPDLVIGTHNLTNLGVPIIQLIPSLAELDKNGWWNSVALMTKNSGGVVLEIPNCFGTRHINGDEFLFIIQCINNCLDDGILKFSKKEVPWVYVENVCSMIWFIIENKININHIKMPTLVQLSEFDIAELIVKLYDREIKIESTEIVSSNLCKDFNSSSVLGWQPDDLDVEEALEKTALWYKSNRWALC